MSGSSGSGLFGKQAPTHKHLVQGHGLGGEVTDMRRDVAKTFAALVAVAIEEFSYPPAAQGAALQGATASAVSAQRYAFGGAQGVILSPPRNVEVVVSGAGTPGDAPASVTFHGFDAYGRAMSETIPGTSGGAATYAGTKCFARVMSADTAAGAGAAASFTLGTGVVIGLSQMPKMRAGQVLPLIRREVFDGSVVTNGALTLPATNLPFGAYTPNTAPTTQAPASHAGSVDITAAGLYGGAGTLDGTDLVLTVNGVGPTTLSLIGLGNALNEAALLAAIKVAFPALAVTEDGSKHLSLATLLQDAAARLVVAADIASTANPFLGLTAGTYSGAGHQYCIEYEFDASLVTDA
jgi:hypothetical protein